MEHKQIKLKHKLLDHADALKDICLMPRHAPGAVVGRAALNSR